MKGFRWLLIGVWLLGLLAEALFVKQKLPLPYAVIGLGGTAVFVALYDLLAKRLLARKEDYYA